MLTASLLEDAVSGTQQDNTQLLQDRYGKKSKRLIDTRVAWAGASGLIIAGLIFLFFGGWNQTSTVETRDISYDVVSDTAVVVKTQVSAPSNTRVNCAFEALSTSYAVVGYKVVELPPSEKRTRILAVDMVTTTPATTGAVRDCWVAESE